MCHWPQFNDEAVCLHGTQIGFTQLFSHRLYTSYKVWEAGHTGSIAMIIVPCKIGLLHMRLINLISHHLMTYRPMSDSLFFTTTFTSS